MKMIIATAKERQLRIEKEIWFAEINSNKTMAGNMPFCRYCKKKGKDECCPYNVEERYKETPCIRAKHSWQSGANSK